MRNSGEFAALSAIRLYYPKDCNVASDIGEPGKVRVCVTTTGGACSATGINIRMWDVEACACVRVFEGHTKTIRSIEWSADQNQVLSASYDATARIWDAQTGQCLKVLE